MSSEKKLTAVEFHRQMAVELFNLVWNLLDKDDRSQAKVDQMIHTGDAANADRYLQMGKDAGEQIAKQEDREYYFSQLADIRE